MGWSWFRSLMYRQTIRCDHFRTAKIPFEKGQVTNNYRNQNLVLNHPVVGMSTVFLRIICFFSRYTTWEHYPNLKVPIGFIERSNSEHRVSRQLPTFFQQPVRLLYPVWYSTRSENSHLVPVFLDTQTNNCTMVKRIVWQGYCRQ